MSYHLKANKGGFFFDLYYLRNMTLLDFTAMDEMEQQEAIWEGVHIAERDDGEHRILLY